MASLPVGRIEAWARRNLAHPEGARWPGKWRLRHPAYRAALLAAGDPATRRLIVRAHVQGGKTELLAVLAAYFATAESAPVLVYSAGLALTRALGDRLIAFYRAARNDALREAYTPARPPPKRTIAGGGSIEVVNSTSVTAFQMRTARIVLLDEVRSHPGSLLIAAEGRQAAWADMNPLTVLVSSAGVMQPCRISEQWERSDAQTFRIEAPCCGHEIPCDWGNVDGYGKSPNSAYLRCPRCASKLPGKLFKRAVKAGRFVATRQTDEPGSVGFHIPEIIHPGVPLGETARKQASAHAALRNTGQPRELQDFHADALALTYTDPNATVDPELARVQCRLPGYDPAEFLPPWVSLLTMSADVQIDRLEIEIAGWGALQVSEEGEASRLKLDQRVGWTTWRVGDRHYRLMRCGVHYDKLKGDPHTDEPWAKLNALRMKNWRIGSPDGPELRPGLTLCDAGGHHTERVREWSRSSDASAAACKGASRPGQSIARLAHTRSILEEYGKPLCFVGGDAAKDVVLGSVRRATMTGDQSWCWPDGEKGNYNWQYFHGLLASETKMQVESRIERRVTARYIKSPSQPNEPLDLAVYNLAALAIVGLHRLLENAKQMEPAR